MSKGLTNSGFSTPHSFAKLRCASTCFLISTCARSTACIISSSVTKFKPASTIITESSVPAITMFMSPFSTSLYVGLIIILPSILPILTAPIGPSNGAGLNERAKDAPIIA